MPNLGISTENRILGRAERKYILKIAEYTLKNIKKFSHLSPFISLAKIEKSNRFLYYCRAIF